MPPRRTLSLLPGATEMVAALGCADRLVGRSHECDFPETIRQLPVCTRTRLEASASSGEIHQGVGRLVAQALSLFELDLPLIRELRPDLILTQAQCEVCAVSVDDVESVLAGWLGERPRVLSFSPRCLDDVFADMFRLGEALAVADRAAAVVSGLRGRLEALRAAAAKQGVRPTVVCLEWFEPLMVAGNWVPELVEIAGSCDLLGKAVEHSPWIEWNAIRRADPDVIILMPCGFDLARTVVESDHLRALPGWSDLKAVRAGRVVAVDGNSYFNRPGPRLVESAEILAEVLWRDIILDRKKRWQRLSETPESSGRRSRVP